MNIDPAAFWPEIRKEHSSHFHALGVIIATFNGLEFALHNLFQWFLKIEDSISAHKIFGAMSNPERTYCLSDAIDRSKESEQVKDLVRHFLKGFEILSYNRNLLAHSHTMITSKDQPHVRFQKGSRHQPHRWGATDLTVPQLHQVAQDTHNFELFGLTIFGSLKTVRDGVLAPDGKSRIAFQLPLPGKPPLPEKLKSVPPEDRQPPQP